MRKKQTNSGGQPLIIQPTRLARLCVISPSASTDMDPLARVGPLPYIIILTQNGNMSFEFE